MTDTIWRIPIYKMSPNSMKISLCVFPWPLKMNLVPDLSNSIWRIQRGGSDFKNSKAPENVVFVHLWFLLTGIQISNTDVIE